MLKKIVDRYSRKYWQLGFVIGGMKSIMENEAIKVEWVPVPKDRWFADPFILDVTESEIQLLVEDYPYATKNGIISLLKIDRKTKEIKSRKELLELPTHLSFPAILRENGHIYVYPESAGSGRLDMYEYHPETESLEFYKTICDDVVWDSCITDLFGERMLFTAAHNDYILDIYKWDEEKERFVPSMQVKSYQPNCRLAGQPFEYNGECYYPSQDCTLFYGGAVMINQVRMHQGGVFVNTVRSIHSPHKNNRLGCHTMNTYNDMVVIDVHGCSYPMLGFLITKLVKWRKSR